MSARLISTTKGAVGVGEEGGNLRFDPSAGGGRFL